MDSSQARSVRQAERQYRALIENVLAQDVGADSSIDEALGLVEQWWECHAPSLPSASRDMLATLRDQVFTWVALSRVLTDPAGVSAGDARRTLATGSGAGESTDLGLEAVRHRFQRSVETILGIPSVAPESPGTGSPAENGRQQHGPVGLDAIAGPETMAWHAALDRYRDALREYGSWSGEVAAASVERAQRRLRDTRAAAPATLRALLESWVDDAETVYARASRTERYSKACGALVNALTALRTQLGDSIGPPCADSMPDLRTVSPAGITPREMIYREDRLRLYAYGPRERRAGRAAVPVLIVYALVNRPYVLDLAESRSTIQGLLNAGLDPYLIDWGYPAPADTHLDLSAYINGYLDHCVDAVRRVTGRDRVNLLGVCQGGTFALCYSALEPGKVANLVTMVTPVDFHTPDNQLTRLVRYLDVDGLVEALGNVPGALLNWAFLSLQPHRLTAGKFVDVLDKLGDEKALGDFLAMEGWILDSPDQAGVAFREFVKTFFQDNALIKGTAVVGDRRVDLAAIRAPVLNVYATRDHLVPPAASRALREHLGGRDYDELEFDGGHIGIYVSRRAQRRIAPAIGAWLHARPSR